MTPFTIAAMWVFGILGFSAIAVCLWLNWPEPPRRRQWRDHDEHEDAGV
jgi:hypothetical protein